MGILEMWLKKAEDATGLPMLLQGQQGQAPDTLGATQIVNNNGTTVLRRIARIFDDRVTERHIGRYYEFLMLHGPDEAKGDFTIDARGSSALVERASQKLELMQMVQLALNPAYGMDPELVISEVMKSMNFDPKRMVLSDEKKQTMAQQPPPVAPQVEVAKIRGALEMEKTDKVLAAKAAETDKRIEADLVIDKNNVDRDTAYVEAQREKNAQDGIIALRKMKAEFERDQLKFANDNKLSLDDVRAKLADTSIKANLQRELAHVNNKAKQVMKPPVEPPGKARPWTAYQA